MKDIIIENERTKIVIVQEMQYYYVSAWRFIKRPHFNDTITHWLGQEVLYTLEDAQEYAESLV